MSLLEAWRFLKYKRPIIFPNDGFVEKLRDYEISIKKAKTSSVSDALLMKHPMKKFQGGGKKRRSSKTRKTRKYKSRRRKGTYRFRKA